MTVALIQFQLIDAKKRTPVGRKFTDTVNPRDATACTDLLSAKARVLKKPSASLLLVAYENGRKVAEYGTT
jgi:hypothetical protein